MGEYHQFIVVGGGIGGIHACELLALYQKDFILIEASDRIGGRILTHSLGEIVDQENINFSWIKQKKIRQIPVECGATWLASDHDLALSMVKQFGIQLYPQYYDGKAVYGQKYGQYVYVDSIKDYFAPHQQQLRLLVNKIDEMTIQFHKMRKEQAKSQLLADYIKKYDHITLGQFISQTIVDKELALKIINEIQTLDCISVNKMSMLQIIDGCDQMELVKLYCGKLDIPIDGLRVKVGVNQFVRLIQDKVNRILKQQKDNSYNIHLRDNKFIRFNHIVQSIENQPNSLVKLKTKNNKQYQCKTVLFSVPLAVIKKIQISNLSIGKKLIIQNQQNGRMGRYFMIFKEAFWRSKYSGYGSFSHEFPFNQIVELSPSNLECGILGFILVADGMERLQKMFQKSPNPHQSIHNYFLKIIADLYLNGNLQHDNLKECFSFLKTFSNNQFIQAAYNTRTKSGIRHQFHQKGIDYITSYLRDQNNILFIGTQFAEQYPTYMEGALRNARKKVHLAIKKQDPLLPKLIANHSKL